MKNYLLSKVILFVVFLNTSNVNAQVFPSQRITIEDGLPSNTINDITLDKYGTYWAATENGLAKIEGNKITAFSVKDGLPHNNCWQVKIDNNGKVWTGTYGGGISIYDGNKFTNINEENGLINNYVRRLYYRSPYLYVGTKDGLSVINTSTLLIKNYTIFKEKIQVMDFFEYEAITYAVTYQSGTFKIKNDDLFKVNEEKEFFSCFLQNDTLILSKDGNRPDLSSIHKIPIRDFLNNKSNYQNFGTSVFWNYIQYKNNFFGCAWGVNYESGGFYNLNGNETIKINDKFNIESNNLISGHLDENRNVLLLATTDKGLYKIDLNQLISFDKKNNLLYFKNFNSNTKVLLYDESITIEKNKQSSILNKIEFIDHIKKELLFNNLNEKFSIELRLRNFLLDIDNFSKIFKVKSTEYQEGNLFVMTNIGLFKLKELNNKFNINQYYPISSSNSFIFNETNGLIYQYPFFKVYFIKNIDKSMQITSFDLDKVDSPRDIIKFIEIEDKIVAVSRYSGIYYYSNQKFKSLLHNKTILEKEFLYAKKDKNNVILLADYLGNIYQLTIKNQKIHYNKIVSFDSINGNTILGIEKYNDFYIIATNQGLNFINKSKSIFIDEEQNFDAKAIKNISLIDGILEVATKSGLYNVNLDYILNQKSKANILMIKSLVVNGSREKQITNSVKLEHNQNKIDIILGSNTIVYPKKFSFRYRILGLNNDSWSQWINWNNSNNITIPFLPSGDFIIEIQYEDKFSGIKENEILMNISIKSPFWKTTWFYLLSSSILLFILFLLFKHRIEKIKKRHRERISFEKKITESRNSALKSQMNPHFVFNAINAIQNFVVSNDVDSSINYMNSFSELIRKTLDYSSKETITVNEEIKFLKNYVKIQNLRFGNQIKFKAKVNPNLNSTEIPPMLLQPIIENCFEHAFDKTIKNPEISIEFNKTDNGIMITINDNGIGYKKSKTNTSKGLKLIEERLELLSPKNQLSINTVSGTSVEIFIYEE